MTSSDHWHLSLHEVFGNQKELENSLICENSSSFFVFHKDFIFGFYNSLILFENLLKPRSFHLQPQNSVLSNLRLASSLIFIESYKYGGDK